MTYLDVWTLIATNVCYEGRGSAYGSFRFKTSGMITSLKLEHVSGLITCMYTNPDYGSTIWTCHKNKEQLSTFVTNNVNEILFPPGVALSPTVGNIRYANRTAFKMEPKTLIYYGPTLTVSPETELRIWNANDLGGDKYDQDNRGRHCVNVFGRFDGKK